MPTPDAKGEPLQTENELICDALRKLLIAMFHFVASGLSVLGWTRTQLAGLALGGPARLAKNYNYKQASSRV